MKRVVFVLLCGVGQVQAQVHLDAHYVGLLPIGGMGSTQPTSIYGPVYPEVPVGSIMFNLGRGNGLGVAVSGPVGGLFRLEIRATYVDVTDQQANDSYSEAFYQVDLENEWNGSYTKLEPALRMSSGTGSWSGYMVAGPSFAFFPQATSESRFRVEMDDPRYPPNYYLHEGGEIRHYSGGIGLGGFGGIGLLWKSKGSLNFFAEFQASAMSWAPSSSDNSFDERLTNQVDVEYSSTTRYVDEVDPQQNDEAAKIYLPMSTWGVRAGIQLVLRGSAAESSR
jgi:hypothetical protein